MERTEMEAAMARFSSCGEDTVAIAVLIRTMLVDVIGDDASPPTVEAATSLVSHALRKHAASATTTTKEVRGILLPVALHLLADPDMGQTPGGEVFLCMLLGDAQVWAVGDTANDDANGTDPLASSERDDALATLALAVLTRVAAHDEITSAPELLACGDRAMELVFRLPSTSGDSSKSTTDMAAWRREVAQNLFRVHECGGPRARADFRVMTFVWKNLTKCATAYGAELIVQAQEKPTEASEDMNVDSGDGSTATVPAAATGDTETGTETNTEAQLLSPTTTPPGPRFNVEVVYEALLVELALSAQALRVLSTRGMATRGDDEDKDDQDQEVARTASLRHELKMLRLFFRAFQGHFVQFAESMVAQVESSLAIVLDITAALVPIVDGHSKCEALTSSVRDTATRILQGILVFAEHLATPTSKLHAATRGLVSAWLWQPSQPMFEAVQRIRTQLIAEPAEDITDATAADVRAWSHTLVLAAYYAAASESDDNGPSPLPQPRALAASIEAKISNSRPPHCEWETAFVGASALLERYRASRRGIWLTEDDTSDGLTTRSLFVDAFLQVLYRSCNDPEGDSEVATLQLFLLQQTLHPDSVQRFLMWELWREFICYCWDEETASGMLQTLLYVAGVDGLDEALPPKSSVESIRASGVRDEMMQLVAFLYAELSGAMQTECLRMVTATLDMICGQGPMLRLSPSNESVLTLLDALAPSGALLAEYHGSTPEKEEWVASYLPLAVECIGTVLDLLEKNTSTHHQESPPLDGVLRILHVCLLVVQAVADDDDRHMIGSENENLGDLSSMIVPMCAETLTRLAELAARELKHHKQDQQVGHSYVRSLDSCLHLLSRPQFAAVIKRNQANRCVQVIKDLIWILDAEQTGGAVSVTVAKFVEHALCDVIIHENDYAVTYQLFARLFRKLSALHFTASPLSLSAPQAACLHAFYAVLARSNLAACIAGGAAAGGVGSLPSVQDLLEPAARAPFRRFLEMMQISKDDTLETKFMLMRSHRDMADAENETMRQRFPHLELAVPEGNHAKNNKRQRVHEEAPEMDGGSAVMDEAMAMEAKMQMEKDAELSMAMNDGRNKETVPVQLPHYAESLNGDTNVDELRATKRLKWERFAELYWQLHDQLSAVESPQELENVLTTLSTDDLERAGTALEALLKKTTSG